MESDDAAPTGETFLMCSPKDRLKEIWDPAQRVSQHNYDVLCDTIERCGGELILDRAIKPNWLGSQRNGMFTRDVGIVLPKAGVPTLFTPEHHGVAGKREIRQASDLARYHGVAQETIPGRVDGGNLVYDATRHLLFVGVNNYNHIKYFSDQAWRQEDDGTGRLVWTPHDPIENVPEHNRQRYVMDRIRHAKPNAAWLKAAPEALAEVAPEGTSLRVIPLFLPDQTVDEHFHLDGVFNMLPTGQAVICPSQLSKAALHMVEKYIGRENLIPISNAEANNDAANFITVGSHIITPFASAALKEKFTALGYTVIDPPSVGLEPGAWGFTKSGSVRCVTLKLTPDLGFPGAEKSRSIDAAASNHLR